MADETDDELTYFDKVRFEDEKRLKAAKQYLAGMPDVGWLLDLSVPPELAAAENTAVLPAQKGMGMGLIDVADAALLEEEEVDEASAQPSMIG